jgi:hypothetical protein
MGRQREAGDWMWVRPLTSGPGPDLNQFKQFQTHSNLIRFKQDLPGLKKKIKIKYGFEGFDIRNNFTYRNFLKSKMYFELKIMESSRVWNSMEFNWIFLEILGFDEILAKGLLFAPRWQLSHEKEFEVSD